MNRTNQNSANLVSCVVAVFLLVTLLPSKSYGETCVGTSPRICAAYLDVGDPLFPDHFDVDFTDPDNPDVILKQQSLEWQVWSQVSATDNTADNIGDITLNPAAGGDDYEVQIRNGYTGGFGAVNVGSLVLDGASLPGWSGHSSIAASSLISGSVTGDIVLVDASSGIGGKLDGIVILGDVTGAITVPHVTGTSYITGLAGDGEVSGDILIEDISSSSALVIWGSIGGDLTVTGTITAGELSVIGDVPATSTVTIGQMSGTARLLFCNGPGNSFDGDLLLSDGVSHADTIFRIGYLDGEVDLDGNDVVGQLRVDNGTVNETIINGGDVSGMVSLSYYPSKDFKGTATFASVPAGGLIRTWQDGGLSGTLNVIGDVAGTIRLEGPFTSSGKIALSGSLTGGLVSGNIVIEEDCGGTIESQNLQAAIFVLEGISPAA